MLRIPDEQVERESRRKHELSEHDHLEGLDQHLRVRRRQIEAVGTGVPRGREAREIEAIGQDRDPRFGETAT